MSVDGIKRTKTEEERVASVFAACFATPAGKEVLAYMKRVSTYRVMPNTSTSEALWHLEGQRHMTMLVSQWIDRKSEGES